MIEVKEKNGQEILFVKVKYPVSEDEARDICNNLFDTVNNSIKSKNWVAGIDMSEVQVFSQSLANMVKDCQEFLVKKGAKRIATLIDSSLLEGQLYRTAKHANSQEITKRFTNKAEWENYIHSNN